MAYERVVTNKPINIVQLRRELGVEGVWDSPTQDGKTEVHGVFENQQVLQDAINAHAAKPDLVEPSIQDQFDALTDKLMSKGLISASEVAQFKAHKPRGH